MPCCRLAHRPLCSRSHPAPGPWHLLRVNSTQAPAPPTHTPRRPLKMMMRAPAAGPSSSPPGPSDDQGQPSSMLHYTLDNQVDVLLGARAVLGPEERMRLDEGDDEEFYHAPRMGVHADQHFARQLQALYMRLLSPRTTLLDLCSSWNSHLPPDMPFASVIGLGMNAEELEANPRLTARMVQDLNRRPVLPGVASSSVHAVTCVNGWQYLTRPEWVMAELVRVMRPGARLVVSFSRHCWESKATSAWLQRGPGERMQLLARLMEDAGLEQVRFVACEGWPLDTDQDTLDGVTANVDPGDLVRLASHISLLDHVPSHLQPGPHGHSVTTASKEDLLQSTAPVQGSAPSQVQGSAAPQIQVSAALQVHGSAAPQVQGSAQPAASPPRPTSSPQAFSSVEYVSKPPPRQLTPPTSPQPTSSPAPQRPEPLTGPTTTTAPTTITTAPTTTTTLPTTSPTIPPPTTYHNQNVDVDPLYAVVATKPLRPRGAGGPPTRGTPSAATQLPASSPQAAGEGHGAIGTGVRSAGGRDVGGAGQQGADQAWEGQEGGGSGSGGGGGGAGVWGEGGGVWREGGGERGLGYGERTPAEVAADYVAPGLREIEILRPLQDGGDDDERQSHGSHDPSPQQQEVRPETLERWRAAYAAMSHDAQALGIPASAIPPLPAGAGSREIRDARDHLEALMASFLSACL